jgi:hypothetical protein
MSAMLRSSLRHEQGRDQDSNPFVQTHSPQLFPSNPMPDRWQRKEETNALVSKGQSSELKVIL